MNTRTLFLAALLAVPLGVAPFASTPIAHSDATSDAAEAAAVASGKKLYRKSWRKGAKACFACHNRGPNKLTARRLKTYPKYDKALRKVVTVQEKLNQMIKSKSGGTPLALGHADLTALEAYIATLN